MAFATSLFITAIVLLKSLHQTDASVGVCYGMLGNNLPCAQDVVNLYESNGIGAMRLYGPDQATLQALLEGTQNIKLMLGVPNEDIPCIASDQPTADEWVQTNIVPYASFIKYIAVGNEINPTNNPLASSVEPAMQNILNSLITNSLESLIKHNRLVILCCANIGVVNLLRRCFAISCNLYMGHAL
ncbi:hypothetical protein BVRB_4g073220 [Beta vulgaris subsp. vulgaris]|nr:hypothetical protein BVRB_4g073220 [Beta vulgaris subsp. vulgaris]